MKKIFLLLLVLLVPSVYAAVCDDAFDLMPITRDTVLCNRAYDVPNGIRINTDGVTLDCNGAILRGTGVADGQGIVIEKADGVTVKNCNIINFDVAIYVKESNLGRIHQNTLLKNKIGVRMLQAFENRFEENADKSYLKPVSAIASKFNTFQLTNKNIDKGFCAVNLCNQPGFMNPCEDNDFYCSQRCSHENDNDCAKPEIKAVTEYPALLDEKIFTTQAPKKTKIEVPAPKKTISIMDLLPEKTRVWMIILLFITAYIMGFLVFQHHRWYH